MNREKNSGIVFIKSPGLGDLQILEYKTYATNRCQDQHMEENKLYS